jgi:general secretion pathway protein G
MKKGFTLIELLIVIAVIAILVGIALPRFRGIQEEGLIAQAKGELRTLQTAVESYYIHNNNAYPSKLSSLTGASPLIVGTLPTDPFDPGSDYGFNRGGTNNQYYVIYSDGPAGNGSAKISGTSVAETNGSSCIYVSNAGTDTTP